MPTRANVALAAVALASLLVPAAGAQDAPQPHASPRTLRLAFIDPLSGPFANAGESSLRHFRAAADSINARGGIAAYPHRGPGRHERSPRVAPGTDPQPNYRLDIVGFDNKASPQETLAQLRLAADQGIRFVVQGQSSAAALALSDAIAKYNVRAPDRAILYLNYAALDPDLTGARCSFWHFRFDADANMRVEALASVLERDRRIRSVYIIGQNYSFGQQVSRAVKEVLARRRPDVRIAGDELHPLGQVRDFAPYIAKIRASGADAVVTGNWGNDLALLVRAAREAALEADFYTFYAGSLGAVTAIGESGAGRVKQVNEWHANVPAPAVEAYARRYKQQFGEDYYFFRINTLLDMFAQAVATARSAEPLAVARALEGMRHATALGEVEMRSLDHQLLAPLFVSTLVRTEARGGERGVRYDVENSGLGFRTDARVESWVTAQPTACSMERPAP